MNLKEVEQKMERLTSRVEGCWLLNRINEKGYGRFNYKYNNYYAHRVSAAIYLNYDLESDLQVNHLCESKNCWNPEHLYIGTKADNVADSVFAKTHESQNRIPVTHCKHGHEYTIENTYTRKDGNIMCRTCHRDREHIKRLNQE